PRTTLPLPLPPRNASPSSPRRRRPNTKGTTIDGLENSIEDSPKPNSNETQKPPDSKKTKVIGISEKTAELKAKIGFLKKKPADFDPKTVACWEKGERVPFLFLCLASDSMSNETSQILITGIGCNMLRTVIYTTPVDLLAMAYLAANKLAPTHEGLELGIGEASIIKFLTEAYGRTEPHIKIQLCSEIVLFGLYLKLLLDSLYLAAKIVKQVFSVLPVYDKVVPALLTSGIWDLPKTCSFTVGVPVEPMKAKSTNSVAKIVNKFQDTDFVCEYKYDGERAQILSTRARKNVSLSDIKVDVCIFAFDILYLNGQALLQEQLEIRKEIGDTLDLLPVAAFHGKRTGVCGSFLLACYDDNNEEYQGIGFTEAVCEECSASLQSKVIPEPKSYYHYTGEMPDVWFEAAEIWEVKGACLTISPKYHAAIGVVDPDKIAEMHNDQNNNEIAMKDDCEDDPGIRLHI
ncbi:hypothetical protein Golob_013901, partial [Gossypium lobatum]|nr:hypothetical protein [Gossypium lobatum]